MSRFYTKKIRLKIFQKINTDAASRHVPFGNTQAIANHLYLDQIHSRYYREDGSKKSPLDVFGIEFTSREILADFLLDYDDFRHPKKRDDLWTEDFIQLLAFYTYRHMFDIRMQPRLPLQEEVNQICQAYFEIKTHGFDQSKMEEEAFKMFCEYVEVDRRG